MPQPLTQKHLSQRNKLTRTAWNLVWLLLYRTSPKPLHRWRCFLLRMFGAKIGTNVHPYPSSKIWAPWNLTMHDNACIGEYVDCYCVDQITIGERATISQYSHLCTASHDYFHSSMPLISAPIHIGANSWITTDVFIGPGVSIGDGSVITARSSVFTDIPPWVIARGNPAVPVKARTLNPEAQITNSGN